MTRLDRSKDIASNMRTDKKITITGLFLLVAAALLNIQHQSSLAFAAGNKNVLYLCKEDTTTDIFELLGGIFAAILFVLSIRAYRKLKIKGMLYVSAAFGIFAARTIAIETRDLYFGGGGTSALQSALSIMFLMAIVLFFIAILQRK